MAARLAAALALCGLGGLFWLAGHRSWSGGRLLPAEARANTGDEPHYLLIVNSILRDHDLQLEDDYWRAWRGGAEAGLAARGRRIDHHTLLVDHADGRAVFWHEAYDWSRPVECGGSRCAGFALRLPEFAPGPGIVEVSSHPIAYPALLAALLAPLRDSPEQVELHAVALSALFGWLACIASYLVARRSGMERRWAVCAALLAGAASPLLAYGRALFPEALLAMVLSLDRKSVV